MGTKFSFVEYFHYLINIVTQLQSQKLANINAEQG